MKRFGKVGAISQETSRLGEFTLDIDRRQFVARRKANELWATTPKKRVLGNEQRANPLLRKGGNSGVDFRNGAGIGDDDLAFECAGGFSGGRERRNASRTGLRLSRIALALATSPLNARSVYSRMRRSTLLWNRYGGDEHR